MEPKADITCGKHDCAVTFYYAPGPVRPYVIACQNLKCGNKGFVRADDADAAETVWRDDLKAESE